MSTMTETQTRPHKRQKVGLALAGIYSLAQVPAVFLPTPEGQEGPPYFILVLGAVLGVAGVVAAVLAWRGSRTATRILAGGIIVVTLTALPAFFVDGIPAGIRILVGISVVWTIAAVYLMFSPSRATSHA
jgi:hypothetical protein